jgi:hypothetical protein
MSRTLGLLIEAPQSRERLGHLRAVVDGHSPLLV